MNSESKRYKLKIRPNGQNQFEVLATSDMLVTELKTIIAGFCQIPASQQMLISQGKILKDDAQLSTYKLSDGFVIQLSARQQSIREPDYVDPSTERREQYRGLQPNERYETIRQGFQTINLMHDILTTESGEEIIGFDNSKRNFSRGQWVDVLDTVQQ